MGPNKSVILKSSPSAKTKLGTTRLHRYNDFPHLSIEEEMAETNRAFLYEEQEPPGKKFPFL